MGRAPCCDKANVKKGPWSPEEDAKLKEFIDKHGTGGNWIALPQKAGLRRCGKSCRLRWLNYLRPNIKHGEFTDEEDRIICTLYATIGSRWSIIAAQLPGRTDNDIKNYWNTKLKKKLAGLPSLPHHPSLQQRTQQNPIIASFASHANSHAHAHPLLSSSSTPPPSSSLSPPSQSSLSNSNYFTSLAGLEQSISYYSSSPNLQQQESFLGSMRQYEASCCSSSDGSSSSNNNNNQICSLGKERDYYDFSVCGNGPGDHHHMSFQRSFCSGVDDDGQKLVLGSVGGWSQEKQSCDQTWVAENPSDYAGLEEIKQLISSASNCSSNNNNSFFMEEEGDDDDDDDDDDELGEFDVDDEEDGGMGKLGSARYEDFFGGKKEKVAPRKYRSSDGLESSTDDEGEENGADGNKGNHNLSTHEKELLDLKAKIEQMEKSNLEPKTWTMQGEVTAAKRPKNSALEVDLDFEHNARPAPVITEEVTASLEELIRNRILEGHFDDVEKPPSLPTKAPREIKELDENKSKRGLAEIYEEEYAQRTNLASAPLSFSDELKKEASLLFKKVCLKLDALSHFHFAPKPIIEDMSIQANVPALAMEEIAPLAVSDVAMLAPEEVFAGKGDIKDETELTQADRKRRRAKKKRINKAEATKRMAKKGRETALNRSEGKEE